MLMSATGMDWEAEQLTSREMPSLNVMISPSINLSNSTLLTCSESNMIHNLINFVLRLYYINIEKGMLMRVHVNLLNLYQLLEGLV